MRQKSAVLRSSCSFFSQLPAAPFSIGLCRRPRFPSGQAQADSNPRHRMGSTYVPRHRKSAPRHGGWWARHGGCGLCFGCAVGGWACVLLLSAQMASRGNDRSQGHTAACHDELFRGVPGMAGPGAHRRTGMAEPYLSVDYGDGNATPLRCQTTWRGYEDGSGAEPRVVAHHSGLEDGRAWACTKWPPVDSSSFCSSSTTTRSVAAFISAPSSGGKPGGVLHELPVGPWLG